MPPVLVHVRRRGPACIVEIRGEIDVAAAPAVREALAEVVAQGHGTVVVDLRRVTLVSAELLAALMNALRRLTPSGRCMAVVAERDEILRLFRLTRLDSTFRLYPSVEAALAEERAAAA